MIEFWLPHLLRRADALLVVVDLNNAPLVQMESILEQLDDMKISIGINETEDKVILSRRKALIVGNKLDLDDGRQNLKALQKEYGEQLPIFAVSATEGIGLEELIFRFLHFLDIIRVYTKTPVQKPYFIDPIILDNGSTMEDVARAVHKDFAARMKYARVWGSGKHDGIRIRRDHVLQDGDVVELHL